MLCAVKANITARVFGHPPINKFSRTFRTLVMYWGPGGFREGAPVTTRGGGFIPSSVVSVICAFSFAAAWNWTQNTIQLTDERLNVPVLF